MDHTGGIWHRQGWRDKLAAGFTNSAGLSGDKLHCLDALMTFACQHSMVWISQGIFPSGTGDTRINRIGSWTGMMAQSDGDKGPDLAPPPGDRETARMFGARVAKAALRWGRD
jgi:multimeric flavodoxin WrbA